MAAPILLLAWHWLVDSIIYDVSRVKGHIMTFHGIFPYSLGPNTLSQWTRVYMFLYFPEGGVLDIHKMCPKEWTTKLSIWANPPQLRDPSFWKVSVIRKVGWAQPSLFWYDKDKDLKVRFLVTVSSACSSSVLVPKLKWTSVKFNVKMHLFQCISLCLS